MRVTNRRVNVYLFLAANFTLSDGYTFRQFVKKTSLDGVIKTTGYISNQSASGDIHCGIVCNKNMECESFFYNENSTVCQLHSTTIADNSVDGLETSPNTVYYAKRDDVFFECPENNGDWTEARLPGGSRYLFKLFRDTRVTQAEAVSSCATAGGTLLKILTKEKMDFVRNNLTKCESADGYAYWVDGSNAEASDPTATDAYKTTDNETVPLTSDIWYPGMPDDPESGHCIWIQYVFSYLLDDVTCSHGTTGAYGVYHICEKILD